MLTLFQGSRLFRSGPQDDGEIDLLAERGDLLFMKGLMEAGKVRLVHPQCLSPEQSGRHIPSLSREGACEGVHEERQNYEVLEGCAWRVSDQSPGAHAARSSACVIRTTACLEHRPPLAAPARSRHGHGHDVRPVRQRPPQPRSLAGMASGAIRSPAPPASPPDAERVDGGEPFHYPRLGERLITSLTTFVSRRRSLASSPTVSGPSRRGGIFHVASSS